MMKSGIFASVSVAVQVVLATFASASSQVFLSQGGVQNSPAHGGRSNEPQVTPFKAQSLAALSSDEYAYLSHPYFPHHSARIKKTTGFCNESANVYTGYIDIGLKHLFFYFFESRSNPDTDDVMLWTNGGPGGSSSIGLFMELGPCNIVSPNQTVYNPYAWNSNANIFFIDQPAGVGFSYSDLGEVVSSTEDAAKDIAVFVALFFQTFESFKGRAFHISGESYAGRYIPLFAAEIWDQNLKLVEAGLTPVNLQSILIGNGATNDYYHFISYYQFQCAQPNVSPLVSISACVRMQKALPRCLKGLQKSCMDSWDQMDCDNAYNFCGTELVLPYFNIKRSFFDVSQPCPGYSCYEEEDWIEAYLNSEVVRKTIGIDPEFGNFTAISQEVNAAFTLSGDHLHENQLQVAELLHRGVRVLIYAGEYDFICNWIGNELWSKEMDWAGRADFASQPLVDWFVDGNAAGITRTSGNLTFATIHSAGHMVPHDKPVESLEMLNRWLSGKAL